MELYEFTPFSDDTFYPDGFMHDINNGEYAKRMKDHNITLLNGECRDEHTMY
jgi:hypothetical protein